MKPLKSLVVGLFRSWVKAYTLGLPDDHKYRRREEIDSDLWEQEQYALSTGEGHLSLAGLVFWRFVFGIPADLSWRIHHAAVRRADADLRMSFVQRGVFGLAIVVALAYAIVGLGVIGAGDGAPGLRLIAGLLLISGAAAIVTTYYMSRPSAARGVALVLFGAFAWFLMTTGFWIPAAFVSIAALIKARSYVSMYRSGL